MLGAIVGDIVGSVYEHSNHRFKTFSPLFHSHARFTDDTVCTVAVADALVNGRHAGESLKDWGRRYLHNGGWGEFFKHWLRSDSLEPYGSWGNGAAMRVSPAGLLATSEEEVSALSRQVTEVTHNHPEGIKGAEATALAIFLARKGVQAAVIARTISERFGYCLRRTPDQIRATYSFDVSCAGTVPEALICGLTAESFEDAVRTAISIGGDSDTIAAIAGSVAEARFGIPDDIAVKAWAYLPADMTEVLRALYGCVVNGPPAEFGLAS